MGMDRITQSTMSATALRGLQTSLGRVQELQQQLSSGKRVNVPSDDPAATAAAMTFRSQRAADEQYLVNADAAAARLNVTDNALTQLSDRLRGARDLMIQSQNGAIGSNSLGALSQQVLAVRQDVVDLYNTRYLDRPIFAGTAQGSVTVDSSGTYVGDDGDVVIRISGDATVRTDVKGTAVGADTVPALLTQIAADVAAGNSAGVNAGLDSLDAALSNVQQSLGDVGARQARVDSVRSLVDSARLDLTSKISDTEDVDLPETIMNLQAQQVAYQSALGAAAKITQVSLADFLK
ncbi:MAG TPA: flagellar hook-associated protein FlgL [Kineosporiaceae bacterium]|nr:flagellar hook-associated protein FlgL [Kineosporiaceae bacterium]